MAGTRDVLQRCYLGLRIEWDRLVLDPRPPAALADLQTLVTVRGHRLRLALRDAWLHLCCERAPPGSPGLLVRHADELQRLACGGTLSVRCR